MIFLSKFERSHFMTFLMSRKLVFELEIGFCEKQIQFSVDRSEGCHKAPGNGIVNAQQFMASNIWLENKTFQKSINFQAFFLKEIKYLFKIDFAGFFGRL